jgi:hypothetical protein
MYFFIDESGNLLPREDRGHAISCVGCVIVPGRLLDRVEAKFKELTANWPKHNGEVKGKLLDEGHVAQLCSMLQPMPILFVANVMDLNLCTRAEITDHQLGQAGGMTENLTAEHSPYLTAEVWRLRRTLEKMPPQLPDFLAPHVRDRRQRVNDLKLIFERDLSFLASEHHIGVQIADVLVNALRRGLSGRLQAQGWKEIKKLIIRETGGSLRLMTFGDEGTVRRAYAEVVNHLNAGGRSMLTERSNRKTIVAVSAAAPSVPPAAATTSSPAAPRTGTSRQPAQRARRSRRAELLPPVEDDCAPSGLRLDVVVDWVAALALGACVRKG